MNIFTVSFFGHRDITNYFRVAERLEEEISRLIKEKEYVEFLVGREGEFDLLVASTVRRVSKLLSFGNSSLVLVLPYMKAEYQNNEENFNSYYSEVEICEESAGKHFKSAIQIRNRSMIDRSNLVICCIGRETGGAYQSVQYAIKKNVNMINLA